MSSQQSSLDHFISNRSQTNVPKPVFITREIVDRNSLFKAAIFSLTSPAELEHLVKFSKSFQYQRTLLETHPTFANQPPTHNIRAWRYLALKHPSKPQQNDPTDYSVQSGYDDDGERWAGSKVLKLMENQATIDALVIVSRWFGGTMLGPVRFQHIEAVARQACQSFRLVDELADKRLLLARVDLDIARLREDLRRSRDKNPGEPAPGTPVKPTRIPLADCPTRYPTDRRKTLPSSAPTPATSSATIHADAFDKTKLEDELEHLKKLLFSKQKSLDFLHSSLHPPPNKPDNPNKKPKLG